MRKLLLSLMLLSAALAAPPSSRAQFIVVGQGCGGPGLTGIANDGTPVVCRQNPPGTTLVWTAVGSSGGGSSSIGAATNVKSLGAVGNGKFFVDGVTNAGNNQLTSATASFSSSDVGQSIYCIKTPLSPTAALWAAGSTSTITSFVNSSTITYSGTNGGVASGQFCALLNPADPTAIATAFSNCKSNFNAPNQGVSSQQPPCSIYIPAGVWGVGATLDNLITTGAENCVGIIGDGMEKTMLIPTANFTNAVHANGGWFINERCAGALLRDFVVEATLPINSASQVGAIVANSANALIQDVAVYDQCNSGAGLQYGIAINGGSNVVLRRPTVITSGNCSGTSGGLLWFASEGDVFAPFLSNSNQNLQIQNQPSGSGGSGVRIWGGTIDEGSVTKIVNSIDVWMNGVTLTGGANCLNVDGTSFVWLSGGYCGTFSAGVGGGPTVASGGVLNMTQVHVQANGASSACYTSAAYGGIVDDGTNNCTLVSGGTVYPAGGFTNKTSLSHLPFNAFQTGTLAVTTNLQTFVVDQPVQIQTFSWTPNNAFACTAGSFPTFSMSDGTVTVTTSVNDTSASGTVTHTFANTTANILNPSGTVGAVLTVKVISTGTCGTAPTNVNINIWGQATAPGV